MKRTILRLIAGTLGLTVAGLAFVGPAQAQFPDKGLTLIVAYGAGGGTDTTARLLAKDLEETLRQPVTV